MSNSRGRRAAHPPRPAAPSFSPQLAAALQRALALHQQGQLAQAEAAYRAILKQAPGHFDALHLLGVVKHQRQNFAASVELIGRALRRNPNFAPAHFNIGNALAALGRHAEALASFERALALQPGYAEALSNRGNALLALRRPTDALQSYDRALALQPRDAETLYNRGNALLALQRADEALASYDQALAIEPGFALARTSRGNALVELGHYAEAAREFKLLQAASPDFDYAAGQLLYARLGCCDWDDYDRNAKVIVDQVSAGKPAASPFTFLCLPSSPIAQLKCAQTYSTDRHPRSKDAVWKGERYRHERIRVAYLSGDFHNHAIAYLIAGLIEAHDKSRFETTAISFGPDSTDEMRARLASAFDRFIDVRPRTDRDTALLLRELEIDIAVDLKGHTQGSRTGIFAFRPAPVQVNWLGYPGTMGVDYIDYILADRVVIPEGHHTFYSEKVAYLPDTYQANDNKRPISGATPSRAVAGLPHAGFVFCSFNNTYKIAPSVFDVWMRLLREVEGSALWLLETNPAAVGNLRWHAEERGVAPQRLIFAPRVPLEYHLARHRLAGVVLDNLPYNAHTTASDALWAGVPVVTCIGSSFAGRVAASLLNAVGLPELVTGNLTEYQALALRLARDERLLAALRAKLAQNRETHPLFDTDRFRRHLESAYQTMWGRAQRGLPPVSFAVPEAATG
jgi:protein O-GlcNAc transferase